jgi:hypothetical protein
MCRPDEEWMESPQPPVSDVGGSGWLSGLPPSKPRSRSSERSEVAGCGASNQMEPGGPGQSARSVCLPCPKAQMSRKATWP